MTRLSRSLLLLAPLLALPVAAQAAAWADVTITRVLLQPDGRYTESGPPVAKASSFSEGVASLDYEFGGFQFDVAPGQTLAWDFRYTVSMHADGLSYPGTYPRACAGLPFGPCSPPPDGQELAWAHLYVSTFSPRGTIPHYTASGDVSLPLTLRDGSLELDQIAHLSVFGDYPLASGSGSLIFGATTLAAGAAPIPEPGTFAQAALGLALLVSMSAFGRRRRG